MVLIINDSSPYPVQNVGPTLKSNTLKHSQHWKSKVVEVGDAEIGTFPKLSADVASFCITFVVATTESGIIFVNHFTWTMMMMKFETIASK